MEVAYNLMHGIDGPLAVDLENTDYLLSFGTSLLEAWEMPLPVHRAYGYLRQGRPGPKAKIVHVGSRFSRTASKSDEWIPIKPGTEAALALGIAYIMVKEELYDKDFIDKHCFGFEDWTDGDGRSHLGFKNLLLREYRPDTVSTITGVPVDTIIHLAKEFGARKPSIAIGGKDTIHHTNGTYAAMAIHALNGLSGSIDVEGGIKRQSKVPFKEWPEEEKGSRINSSLNMNRVDIPDRRKFPITSDIVTAIAENILEDIPYKVNALLLNESNPLYSSSNPSRFQEAFEKIPYIVSFTSLMNESTEYADLILPNHTYLERWQDCPVNPYF
jgi:anaerobic selenocysteine-containing dehydrogenase